QHDFAKVRSEAIKSVKRAFDEANIVLPYPVYNLKISHDKNQSIQKIQEKVDSTKKISIQEVELHNDEIKDMTVDRTVEKQIAKENVQPNSENLLDPNTPDEI
ncbi:MAG: mechanosensitive ion channel protein MscS, partial [Gammaproteobacteria bacterium]